MQLPGEFAADRPAGACHEHTSPGHQIANPPSSDVMGSSAEQVLLRDIGDVPSAT